MPVVTPVRRRWTITSRMFETVLSIDAVRICSGPILGYAFKVLLQQFRPFLGSTSISMFYIILTFSFGSSNVGDQRSPKIRIPQPFRTGVTCEILKNYLRKVGASKVLYVFRSWLLLFHASAMVKMCGIFWFWISYNKQKSWLRPSSFCSNSLSNLLEAQKIDFGFAGCPIVVDPTG